MSIFAQALEQAAICFEQVAGEEVVYLVGLAEIVIADAVAETASSSETRVGGGVRSTTRELSWLVRASELTLNGTVFEPQIGHKFRRANGQVYQVQRPGGGSVWEWIDGHDTRMRIHSIEVRA